MVRVRFLGIAGMNGFCFSCAAPPRLDEKRDEKQGGDMSTRSIIARATGEGTFKGVYHHWDGYPTGLGKYLTKILADPFGKDLARTLRTLMNTPRDGARFLQKIFLLRQVIRGKT